MMELLQLIDVQDGHQYLQEKFNHNGKMHKNMCIGCNNDRNIILTKGTSNHSKFNHKNKLRSQK